MKPTKIPDLTDLQIIAKLKTQNDKLVAINAQLMLASDSHSRLLRECREQKIKLQERIRMLVGRKTASEMKPRGELAGLDPAAVDDNCQSEEIQR